MALRRPRHILAPSNRRPHGRANFLFEDKDGGAVTPVGVGVMDRYGHVSYLPGKRWILNDNLTSVRSGAAAVLDSDSEGTGPGDRRGYGKGDHLLRGG